MEKEIKITRRKWDKKRDTPLHVKPDKGFNLSNFIKYKEGLGEFIYTYKIKEFIKRDMDLIQDLRKGRIDINKFEKKRDKLIGKKLGCI